MCADGTTGSRTDHFMGGDDVKRVVEIRGGG